MAQLYADEDFSYPAVEELRRFGHEVLTAQEAGEGGEGKTDEEVLAFAVAEHRAVLTFNRRHFIHLHQKADSYDGISHDGISHDGISHYGIIVCTRDPDPIALAVRIDQSLTAHPTMENHLVRVTRP